MEEETIILDDPSLTTTSIFDPSYHDSWEVVLFWHNNFRELHFPLLNLSFGLGFVFSEPGMAERDLIDQNLEAIEQDVNTKYSFPEAILIIEKVRDFYEHFSSGRGFEGFEYSRDNKAWVVYNDARYRLQSYKIDFSEVKSFFEPIFLETQFDYVIDSKKKDIESTNDQHYMFLFDESHRSRPFNEVAFEQGSSETWFEVQSMLTGMLLKGFFIQNFSEKMAAEVDGSYCFTFPAKIKKIANDPNDMGQTMFLLKKNLRILLENLHQLRENDINLFTNFFEGMKKVSDENFVEFVLIAKDVYIDVNGNPKNYGLEPALEPYFLNNPRDYYPLPVILECFPKLPDYFILNYCRFIKQGMFLDKYISFCCYASLGGGFRSFEEGREGKIPLFHNDVIVNCYETMRQYLMRTNNEAIEEVMTVSLFKLIFSHSLRMVLEKEREFQLKRVEHFKRSLQTVGLGKCISEEMEKDQRRQNAGRLEDCINMLTDVKRELADLEQELVFYQPFVFRTHKLFDATFIFRTGFADLLKPYLPPTVEDFSTFEDKNPLHDTHYFITHQCGILEEGDQTLIVDGIIEVLDYFRELGYLINYKDDTFLNSVEDQVFHTFGVFENRVVIFNITNFRDLPKYEIPQTQGRYAGLATPKDDARNRGRIIHISDLETGIDQSYFATLAILYIFVYGKLELLQAEFERIFEYKGIQVFSSLRKAKEPDFNKEVHCIIVPSMKLFSIRAEYTTEDGSSRNEDLKDWVWFGMDNLFPEIESD